MIIDAQSFNSRLGNQHSLHTMIEHYLLLPVLLVHFPCHLLWMLMNLHDTPTLWVANLFARKNINPPWASMGIQTTRSQPKVQSCATSVGSVRRKPRSTDAGLCKNIIPYQWEAMEFLLFIFRDPESYSGHLDGEKTCWAIFSAYMLAQCASSSDRLQELRDCEGKFLLHLGNSRLAQQAHIRCKNFR